jgi:nucleotide-binding universal stress UspA family protein
VTPSGPRAPTSTGPVGPVLLAYDGSELAARAIEQAGRELSSGREAVVVCAWQPANVGFIPTGERHFDAADASEVRAAAEETAAHGASLAASAGFQPESVAIQAAPTWKGIVEISEARKASLIVFGSHHRSGLAGHLLGSVTAAVVQHTACSVLIVQPPS